MELRPEALDAAEFCFLVDLSRSEEPSLYNALQLKMLRRRGYSVDCSVQAPARVNMRSATIQTIREAAPSPSILPAMYFHLPICEFLHACIRSQGDKYRILKHPSPARSGLEPTGYSPVLDTYEHMIIAAMFAWVNTITTIAIGGIVAYRTKAPLALYIGLGIAAAWLVPCYLAGRVIVRVHQVRLARERSEFLESRAAKLIIAWLANLSVNFAYVEGGPKRWYHFRNWGKYW